MSDSAPTLSQPTSATAGLQGYDLGQARRRRLLNLSAETKASRFRRNWRSWTAAMQKGQVMSQLPQMFETLEKSVVAITSSDSADRPGLLERTFAEFREAIEPELEKAVGDAAGAVLDQHVAEHPEAFEEPMFKGLGTVSRVANLVSMMANAIKRIDEGKEYSSDTDADPASDEVMALLEHALAAAELALRSAVNDHVDVVHDGDEPDEDMNYVTVPNAEAPDDENAALILKTTLPGELAKFACDPAGLSIAAVELGSGLLLLAGVGEDTLGKLFEPDGSLAKSAPPSADPNADPNADPAAAGDPNDLEAQVEIMGRIMAAGLMQVDHIMQMLGASDPSMGADDGTDPNADPSADPNADPAAGGDDGTDPGQAPPKEDTPPAKKGPPAVSKASEADDLRKIVADLEARLGTPNPEVEQLRKSIGSLQGQLQTLAKSPAPAKAVLAGAASLSKAADSGGTEAFEDVLSKIASDYDAARTEDQRTQILLKAAIKLPGVDLSALRKTV